MAQIQGQVSFGEIAAKPEFVSAPPEVQLDVATRFFDDNYGSTPEYQQAPPEVQEDARQRFYQDYSIPAPLPEVGLTPRKPVEPVQAPEWLQTTGDWLGHSAASAVLPFATAAKARTMDYIDLENPLLNYARDVEKRQGWAGTDLSVDSGMDKAMRTMAYGAGALKNFNDIEGWANKGLQSAGRYLLPRTSRLAIQAGMGSKLDRAALNAVSWLQSRGLLSSMTRWGTEAALYEGLKSHPENQFDMGKRAEDAAMGALMGAGGGALLHGVGKAAKPVVKYTGEAIGNAGKTLHGGVKLIEDAINPAGMWDNVATPKMTKLVQRYADLVDHPGLTDAEAETALREAQNLAKAVQEGRLLNWNKLGKKAKMLESRGKLREKAGKAVLNSRTLGAYIRRARTTGIPLERQILDFVPGEDGSPIFAHISPEIADLLGSKTNEVKMQYGYHVPKKLTTARADKDVKGVGYGLLHIEAGHGNEIREMGFKDAEDFLQYVFQNANEVYRQPNGRYVLVVRNGRSKYSFVEVEKVGQNHITVTTAFPEDPKYVQEGKKGLELIWSGRNSRNQVGLLSSSESATVSTGTDSVVSGARAETNSNPQNNTSTTTPQPSSPVKLSGSVKEMVDQIAESVGMKADDLVAAKPKDLTPAQKDARTNIMAVQKSEVINEKLGILRQRPVDEAHQLTFDQVKGDIPEEYRGIAEKVNEALEKDKGIREEYAAEITGRSGKAVKVTPKGNVKVDPTTFTPLYWKKTKSGKVMVDGYNEKGHFVTRHLDPSEEGSQLLKAGKLVDTPFRGEYPNRIYGQREFRAEDILSRGTRSAEGPVKTSDAKVAAQSTADVIKAIENNPNIPADIKKTLSKIGRKKKVSRLELMSLRKHFQNQKDSVLIQEFCKLMGL